jgi:hypothetical protein
VFGNPYREPFPLAPSAAEIVVLTNTVNSQLQTLQHLFDQIRAKRIALQGLLVGAAINFAAWCSGWAFASVSLFMAVGLLSAAAAWYATIQEDMRYYDVVFPITQHMVDTLRQHGGHHAQKTVDAFDRLVQAHKTRR